MITNKYKLTALAVMSLALAGLLACGEAAKPTANVADKAAATPTTRSIASDDHEDEHDAPRIPLEEAKRDFDAGTAVFIDTHPPQQFEMEHIPGAINIQANTIKQNLDKVPKGKKIIVYCS